MPRWTQHPRPGARRREGEDPGPERRRRSLRQARAIRRAQEGSRCGEGGVSDRRIPGAVHAFTNPEATALGQKFNLPLRYDAQVDREAKDEALKILCCQPLEEEGLTGLATVGRSAANEPRFIVLEHRKGGDAAPIVLVGKAVTFDSGGISIKPSAGMENMKFDMSGGAAVLGAMEAVGDLDLPLNVVALVPATENLPGGDAFKPGDVLTMHSGKTVEIVTTDAEGRLILADALSYARRYEPSAVVDCATLTGACVVALGNHASGLMGNDEDLIAEVQAAGETVGERAWPLPLFDEYTEQIKGDTADIKNSARPPRWRADGLGLFSRSSRIIRGRTLTSRGPQTARKKETRIRPRALPVIRRGLWFGF